MINELMNVNVIGKYWKYSGYTINVRSLSLALHHLADLPFLVCLLVTQTQTFSNILAYHPNLNQVIFI